jgi:hypothetical protein
VAGRDAVQQVGTQCSRSGHSAAGRDVVAGREAVQQVGTQCSRSGHSAAGRDVVAGREAVQQVGTQCSRSGHGAAGRAERRRDEYRSGNSATSSKRFALSLERS